MVYNVVQINEGQFSTAVSLAKTNVDAIYKPVCEALPDMSSRSIALDEYIAQLSELQSLIGLYQSLASTDLQTIQAIGNSLIETDQTLAREGFSDVLFN
ncbi:TIGR04197 family type VII secretion effector [Listeria weihenstephanensis]|uniref:TIGR04197 family type VII secretion effector n=1 Tax=Listeria weihenstephanensis TaxID=1006155 RepID=A0A841Z828_9LIST|nr:TIGR04197 family type VII secretion effector [Listeria weihenstephanensis]MBC1501370.1 TIGR04197 family type VII secretion effector [Listeria weihenstephanensis]